MVTSQLEEVIHVGVLEIRVRDGLLLVALAERAGTVVRRDELYRLVWGGPLRDGDRSIDVYVRKLRVKLATALPEWCFIHTHVGFGYRLDPEPSPPFHNGATTR